jgi:hypothetical protein
LSSGAVGISRASFAATPAVVAVTACVHARTAAYGIAAITIAYSSRAVGISRASFAATPAVVAVTACVHAGTIACGQTGVTITLAT